MVLALCMASTATVSTAAVVNKGLFGANNPKTTSACRYPVTSNPATATITMVCRLKLGVKLYLVGNSNGRDGTLTSIVSCWHWPTKFTLTRHHLGKAYAQVIGGGNYIRLTGAPLTAHCKVKLTASLPGATWDVRVKDPNTRQMHYQWWITLKQVIIAPFNVKAPS